MPTGTLNLLGATTTTLQGSGSTPLPSPTTTGGGFTSLAVYTTTQGLALPVTQPTTSSTGVQSVTQPATSSTGIQAVTQPTTSSTGIAPPVTQPATSSTGVQPIVQPTTSSTGIQPVQQPTTSSTGVQTFPVGVGATTTQAPAGGGSGAGPTAGTVAGLGLAAHPTPGAPPATAFSVQTTFTPSPRFGGGGSPALTVPGAPGSGGGGSGSSAFRSNGAGGGAGGAGTALAGQVPQRPTADELALLQQLISELLEWVKAFVGIKIAEMEWVREGMATHVMRNEELGTDRHPHLVRVTLDPRGEEPAVEVIAQIVGRRTILSTEYEAHRVIVFQRRKDGRCILDAVIA